MRFMYHISLNIHPIIPLQIIECRRVLKWTYAYGYYLPDHDKKQFFEYLQGKESSSVDRLEKLVVSVSHWNLKFSLDDLIRGGWVRFGEAPQMRREGTGGVSECWRPFRWLQSFPDKVNWFDQVIVFPFQTDHDRLYVDLRWVLFRSVVASVVRYCHWFGWTSWDVEQPLWMLTAMTCILYKQHNENLLWESGESSGEWSCWCGFARG